MKLEQLFDTQQALEVANHDQQIVDKLRSMFLQTLPEQLQAAKQQYQNQQIDRLQEQLHQLLGSARVCAATALIKAIIELKQQLKQGSSTTAWQAFCEQAERFNQL